ncbi:MAG: SET domain-containing protein [Candidatus Aenigmarchaeota archaeon]|nr:SET domain-containing protein [Candidatus Aenigmarchaeota archaeon]
MQIKSYRSSKTEIRESPIKGKGIFAKENIKKGEIVAIKNGHILTSDEYNELGKLQREYCLQIDDNFFIGPKTEEEINENAIFINHSCKPNIGFDGQVVYVALRDIKSGEELTHDYAMCFTKRNNYNFSCNCGTDCCRGNITDNDWKIKELQERYGNHFSWFILKKIKKTLI